MTQPKPTANLLLAAETGDPLLAICRGAQVLNVAAGGTLVQGAKLLKERGAARIHVCATHGIFAADAIDQIENSLIDEILVTDTIPLRQGAPDNLKVLSVADILTDTIRRIFTDDSVSEVFGGENQLF